MAPRFRHNAQDARASTIDATIPLRADPRFGAHHTLANGSPAIDAGTARYGHGGARVLDLPAHAYAGNR